LHILNPNLEELATAQEMERLNKHKTQVEQTKKADEWIGVDDWNFN
jgi:hypothetical protein